MPKFDFLNPAFPQLADAAQLAESYALIDPGAALIKARIVAEMLARQLAIATQVELERASGSTKR